MKSRDLFERALRRIPGGVNSPVRAFRSVGGEPPFLARAKGAHVWDVEGREYIDYIGSWGPMILGHGHEEVVEAVRRQLDVGMSYGAPTEAEVEMAELIAELVPSAEVVRMVNSGTEATMSAIRLARAAAGRDKILKFEGCYHGHGDSFLVKAGSGAATLGVPDSPGVPAALAALTLNARFNDIDSVRALFEANRGQVAAAIVEPVVGNMGCIPPKEGFLKQVREACDRAGALLIFDEVMTGFRVALGGAQARCGVRPDLTTFGKIIGGGLPVGAYGGRRDLMEQLAPSGPVYQAGTLSGNPLAMAAGLATLRHLKAHPEIYEQLEKRGAALEKAARATILQNDWPVCVNRVGSMATIFLHPGPVRSWDEASACDRGRFARYHRAMLERGVLMPPSQFEAFFLSAAHDAEIIDKTAAAMRESLAEAMG
ncbi:MAG: glutamate-1-semialdehyde 2,1-aminomutase [Candidatus Sumerlaeota bacterium]|nr:glutamate-1-semialdehyde 2,1-aminomutase [Candidatus Sumerlaeota bacterium]